MEPVCVYMLDYKKDCIDPQTISTSLDKSNDSQGTMTDDSQ